MQPVEDCGWANNATTKEMAVSSAVAWRRVDGKSGYTLSSLLSLEVWWSALLKKFRRIRGHLFACIQR